MKTLILAEKPSVGRELARVLGCRNKNKCWIEGNQYVVTWAMGHLIELAEPGDYNEAWKSWNLEVLPMIPEKTRHKIMSRTRGQYKAVQSLLKRKDVTGLVLATDAGREGELVGRWIMRLGGWKGPWKRLWISSQTDKAIKEGMAALHEGRKYDPLLKAAECRAEADWLIGLNVTRALSCRYDARLSAGRVQTPTLAMVHAREEQVRNFKPSTYHIISGKLGNLTLEAVKGEKFGSPEAAGKVLEEIQSGTWIVREFKKSKDKEYPPAAYDLTELQREANKKHGYSAKQTLQILQRLYETYKLTTYPRTDSRYITSDMVPTLKERLKALERTEFGAAVKKLQKQNLNPGKHLVNDAKVSDHHALIPTELTADTSRLKTEEKLIWSMITRRFLTLLMPPAEWEKRTLIISADGREYKGSSKILINEGWMSMEGRKTSGTTIPEYKPGDELAEISWQSEKKTTSPPPYLSEALLLTAMEKPSTVIKGTAKDFHGLGTPATRAEIIEKLVSSYYIERNGSRLQVTSRGKELLSVVPEELTHPALTAEWENRFSSIESGRESGREFIAEIKKKTKELVVEVKSTTKKFEPSGEKGKTCPVCGRNMLTFRKKGRPVVVCQSLSCGFEEESQPRRDGEMRKSSRRERQLNQKLMKQYNSQESETFTLADMIKAKQRK